MNLPDRRLKPAMLGLLILCIVAGGIGIGVERLLTSTQVPHGIWLSGHYVGGSSRQQLVELVDDWDKTSRQQLVSCHYAGQQQVIQADDIRFGVNVNDTVEQIFSYVQTGSVGQRLINIVTARFKGKYFERLTVVDHIQLQQLVTAWSERIYQPAINADFSLPAGDLVTGRAGMRLDETKFSAAIIAAFNQQQPTVQVPVITFEPKVTVAFLQQLGISRLQSLFSTRFNSDDKNRSANIKLAATKINGRILAPGEVFSFNEIVGPRDTASGFKEALEFFKGELVPGIGGGVCQVSSTLYNAALLANLQILERSNHTKPLSYVALGRDATVAYGILDFKFVNSSAEPLMVVSNVKDNLLSVAIFGREQLQETVEIVVRDVQQIPPPVVEQPDAALAPGEIKIEKTGAPGYILKTYRVVNVPGRPAKQEFLSKDRYLAEQKVIKVGAVIP